jgi:hypothetical protein
MPDDFGIFVSVPGYIVENSTAIIPEPSTLLLSIIGMLAIERFCREEKTPLSTICSISAG